MGHYDDSDVIETVQCYWCGRTVGCNIAQKFDGKRFCTLRHRENWAKELVRQGATHRKPRKSKTKAPKPTPKTKKKKLGSDRSGKLIAETTLTREQAALKLWCDKRNVLVDFTGDKIAIVYLRMASRWRIGAIEYILRGNRWYPHAGDADNVEC